MSFSKRLSMGLMAIIGMIASLPASAVASGCDPVSGGDLNSIIEPHREVLGMLQQGRGVSVRAFMVQGPGSRNRLQETDSLELVPETDASGNLIGFALKENGRVYRRFNLQQLRARGAVLKRSEVNLGFARPGVDVFRVRPTAQLDPENGGTITFDYATLVERRGVSIRPTYRQFSLRLMKQGGQWVVLNPTNGQRVEDIEIEYFAEGMSRGGVTHLGY